MKKRFERDMLAIMDEQEAIRQRRVQPVYVSCIAELQPLNVLENLILMWPTHDVRYEDGFGGSEDAIMVDMMKSMEQRVIRKDIIKGIIDISVEFLKNLDEIERYNAAARNHNIEWRNYGSPKSVFDPVHGDEFKIADTLVDPVLPQSQHYRMPDSAYNGVSTGRLAQARPDMKKKSHVRIRYQMSITHTGMFVLGYAAYDCNNKVIYYNEVSNKDLAYLVRRSVQEMWGNHTTAKQHPDNLLDGISMLINGKKIVICKKDNKLPEFIAHETTTIKSTAPIRKIEIKEEVLVKTSDAAAYVVPFLLIVGFIACFIWTLSIVVGDMTLSVVQDAEISLLWTSFLETLIKPPMLTCLILLVVTILSRKAAQEADRKASELKATRRFL